MSYIWITDEHIVPNGARAETLSVRCHKVATPPHRVRQTPMTLRESSSPPWTSPLTWGRTAATDSASSSRLTSTGYGYMHSASLP